MSVLIAIEGIDGSGKTTIVKFLADELKRRGYNVVTFKEPTDSEWGKRVKEAKLKPEEELELFLKDREWNVKYNIIPALKSGKIVILDRYYYSTIAYQSARGIDLKLIKKLNERFPKPDLVIILDISPETALKRIKVRGEPDKFEKIEFLKKVRENFLNLKDENVFIINAELDLNTVKEKVLEVILKYLQLKTSPFKGMRKV